MRPIANTLSRGEVQSLLRDYGRLDEYERATLCMVVDGKPNKIIAKAFGVSLRTVETRRQAVFQKMNVESASELARIVAAMLTGQYLTVEEIHA